MTEQIQLDEDSEQKPNLLFKVIHAKRTCKNKVPTIENSNLSDKTVKYSLSPYFLQRKILKDPKDDVLKDTDFDLERNQIHPAMVKDINAKILDLGMHQQIPLERYDPFRIVYANIQSNLTAARSRIKNLVQGGNPPDVIVLHEVPLKTSLKFAEYRTFKGVDGQKTINILTARDLGPTLSVVNNKGYPTLITQDHRVVLMHTLKPLGQHVKFPVPNQNTIIGDFNLRSNPLNWSTFDSYKFKALEPRGCVGIASTVPFNVTWESLPGSDHFLALINLDIKRPPPYSLVNKFLVDSLMESNFLNADVRKLPQKELNKNKAHYPVKMSYGYKQLWQFRDYDINLKASKFISFPLLEKQIKDQIQPLYLGSFRPKDRPIDDRGEEILRVFVRAFFQDSMVHHYHSKARDYNGFSYNKLVKLMYERQDTNYWAQTYRNYWNNLRYVRTRMIALKKKRAIASIRDVRFIAVQDFLMKMFEEICKPLINLVRWLTLNLAAGQYGFQTGISCFDLIQTLIQQDVPNPPTMNLSALIPDYQLWKPAWRES